MIENCEHKLSYNTYKFPNSWTIFFQTVLIEPFAKYICLELNFHNSNSDNNKHSESANLRRAKQTSQQKWKHNLRRSVEALIMLHLYSANFKIWGVAMLKTHDCCHLTIFKFYWNCFLA